VRPVMTRARKSSFTIRVDQLFTPSREGAFTNAHHHPVKHLRLLACAGCATPINAPAT
jgi:hypothetical protein